MMKLAGLLLILSIPAILHGQATRTYSHKIANAWVKVRITSYDTSRSVMFIHLHEDEQTSVDALQETLTSLKRYSYLTLRHSGKRNISGKYHKKKFRVDPNRIFTASGTRQSFKDLNKYSSNTVANSAFKFGQWLIGRYVKNRQLIVAVHNNKDSGFSILHYLDVNESAADAADVFVNDSQDPDNFFLTTERRFFEYFKDLGYNTILQHNENVADDGSLSVYCGRKNIPYINVEVQAGDELNQKIFMDVIVQLIEEIASRSEDLQNQDQTLHNWGHK